MIAAVTGGGTIAPIDDVRHVANASSGRFSAEIAEALLRRGAEVRHVHAPSALLPFARSAAMDLHADPEAEFRRLWAVRREHAEHSGRLRLMPFAGTVAAYAAALRAALADPTPHVAFLAAAVSDFEPEPVAGKIDSDRLGLEIRLRPTPKVIRSVRDWCPSVYLVGFKLLSGSTPEELIARAEHSLRVNRADLVVANDLKLLREGRHTVHLVRPGGQVETLGPGGPIAEGLVDRVLSWAGR